MERRRRPWLPSRPKPKTWSYQTFAGWSTVNTDSYGEVPTYNNFVFASDMKTANGNPNGIVRFDSSGGQTVRFATGTDFAQVALGLDGNLFIGRSRAGAGLRPQYSQAGGNGGYAPGRAGFRHPQHRCRIPPGNMSPLPGAGTSSSTTGTVTSWASLPEPAPRTVRGPPRTL